METKIQEDGKILVAGNFQFYENKRVDNLVRLHPDGTLDESFSYAPDSLIEIKGIDLLSTGEVIVFGYSTLMKLSSSGQALTEIDSIKGINTLNIQADDKIILTTSNYNISSNNWVSALYRLNTDLTIDNTYSQMNRINGQIHIAALQNDKIVIAGEFSKVNAIVKNNLARFQDDGSLDFNFDTGSGTTNFFRAMTVQPDGKILLSHTAFSSFNGIPLNGAGIIRLNTDGSLDTDFRIDPQIDYSESPALLQGTDILVVVHLVENKSSLKYSLCRLKSNGELDLTFTPIDLHSNQLMIVDQSNNIIINSPIDVKKEYLLTRFSSQGQIDTSFDPPLGAYGTIKTGDYFNGSLVIHGDFIRIGDVRTRDLARINPDGSVDPNFIINPSISRSAVVDWAVTQVSIFDDDTIMVALGNRFVKLNRRGELDAQFISEDATWNKALNVGKFHRLDNGKIVTSSPYGINMRNADGFTDTSFQIQTSQITSTLHHLGIQSKGIIYTFSSYLEDSSSVSIRRLNFDGIIDESFNTDSGANSAILDLGIVENNQILVTGFFNQYNGVKTRGLVKLSENGQVDEAFLHNVNTSLPERFYHFYSGKSFRDVYMISVNGSRFGNYELAFLQNDGIYNTDYRLPKEIISASNKILPIVGNADTLILLSRFQLSGQDEPSFALRLTFDDRPIISGTTSVLSTPEDTPLELKLSDLIITHKDSGFPNEFGMIIHEGENFSVEGSYIIPDTGFYGNLTVPVAVNDGKNESDIYNICLKVIPADIAENISVTISGINTFTNDTLINISFSEYVKDFYPSDINITHGSLSALSTKDSITFSAAITPVSDGRITVEVPARAVFNKVSDTNLASNLFVFEYDGTPPTVKLSRTDTNNTVLVTFSEVVKGFSLEDIQLFHASIADLTTLDSLIFIAHILPDIDGELTIKIPSGVAQDQAGNDNEASEALKMFYDEKTSFTLTIAISALIQTEMPLATVILYQKVEGKFTAVEKDKVSDTLSFEDLAEGEYTVGVRPVDTTFLPTYIGDKHTLWEAKTISLYQDSLQYISLLENPKDNQRGGCVVSGILLRDPGAKHGKILTGNTTITGEALEDVPVYLFHLETRKVLMYTVTDRQGRFSFTGLQKGNYLFVADYEGLPVDESQNFIPVMTDFETVSITVIAGGNIRITDMNFEKQVTFVENKAQQDLIRYYPNPVKDEILMDYTAEWIGGNVTIRDTTGKLIKNQLITSNATLLNLDGINSGIYIICLTKEINRFFFKIYKH
ncbi:MAG: Ig-like domain-containing protein [Cyclobacteriaceae bacterium]